MIMPGQYDGGFLLPTTVLYGLGVCMMLGGFLYQLPRIGLLLISVSSFIVSAVYIEQADPTTAFSPITHLLLVPGMSNGAMSLYPVIPWIGVMTFGMFWARLLKKRAQAYTIALQIGLAFLGVFVVLRWFEWANFQHGSYDGLIGFFTLIKYPPSLSFILLACGVNLILLYILSKKGVQKYTRFLLVFGQTAMFFYILHLYLYAIIGIAFPTGCGIVSLYIIWLLGLVPLFFICRWFLAFKKRQPLSSFWRMI